MDRNKFWKVILLLMQCACTELFITDTRNYVDLSRLSAMYIPVCGSKGTCTTNSRQKPLPRVLSSCPDCSCESSCMFTNNKCCFRPFFQSSYVNCRGFTLLQSYHTKQSFNYVIDKCPPNADKELVQKCEMHRTIEERMKYPPVADEATMISYWNRFCASCHGVNRTDKWSLDIQCLKTTDFNYLSSYEEILAVAENETCSVDHTSRMASSCSTPDNIVKSCNVTGTWVDFDPDIQNACESDYHLKYENYKNIFCAMCNPPVFSSDIPQITCTHDQENVYTRACIDQPKTALTYPFNNIYCQKCQYENSSFRPFRTHYTSQYAEDESSPFEYRLQMRYLTENIVYTIDMERKKLTLEDTTIKDDVDNRWQFNISKLVDIAIAAFNEKTCNTSYFQMKNKNDIDSHSCSCHVGCTTSCCVDIALKQPLSCINDAFPPKPVTNGGYYILNGNQITDRTLNSLCNSQNTEGDISILLPVTHFAQGTMASYRNVYCMIGNTPYSSLGIGDGLFMKTHPWVLVSSCPRPATINWPDPNAFLKYTKDINCTLSVYPHKESIVCNAEDADINKCNETGTWNSLDVDVLTACEKTEKFRFPVMYDNALNVSYKNKFCKICNPHFQKDSESECASDFQSNPFLLYACKWLPAVHACTKFKNFACEICNGVSGCNISYSMEMTTSVHRLQTEDEIVYTYRSMFALSEFDSTYQTRETNLICLKEETKLQGTCKKLDCFPGKVNINNSCKPLINNAPNLRYLMNLRMNISLQHPMHVEGILNAVNTRIETAITNSLDVFSNEIQFEKSTLMAKNMCTVVLTNIALLAEIPFFLPTTLKNRMEKEINLVNFTRSDWQTVLDGIHVEIQNNLYTEMGLPTDRYNGSDTCISSRDNPFPDSKIYTMVLVNDLLICRLVTLTNEEFVVESRNRIRLLSFNTVLASQQFRITEDGSYQICFENMPTRLDVQGTLPLQPIAILTGVCTLISILCLLITFATYCMFDSLRTVPGVNSMNLIGSLFFLQLLILSRKYYYVLTSLRILLSILTHFMLLCVFFWLNTCSYHMFRVFIGSFFNVSTSKKRNTLVKYTIYSYGFPFLIVLVNTVVSLSISSGKEFGYGQTETLVDDKLAYIVTFISPLSTICLANFLFFLVTAYKIKSTPKIKGLDQGRLHFIVCLKLSTLTGLTWAFQVIDSFLALSYLSYVVEVLNGLQGFFLFLSYVCNSRVWSLYRKSWRTASLQNSVLTESSKHKSFHSNKSTNTR